MKLGLVVNPIAGMGGAVGLKGTDGPDTVAEARRRGAMPHAGQRARRALLRLAERHPGASLVTVDGPLGADWTEGTGLAVESNPAPVESGTARDTRAAVEALADCDLIAFAGGDGTARDVASALGPHQAMLGIPCGVKMHSGVFAISPEAAGALMADALDGPDRVGWDDAAEIMDIDEEALRAGRLAPRLFGHARAPKAASRVQAAKGGPRVDASSALAGAAADIVDRMDPETLYVIGPGTSAGAVVRAAGHEPTILGIDAMLGGRIVARDARDADLETLAEGHPVRIILGVTGQQGFLIGRGNQQISAPLLSRAGRDGLIVLATEDKLARLAEPRLWVDSGDPSLDAALSGFIRVKTGRGRETMMRVGAS